MSQSQNGDDLRASSKTSLISNGDGSEEKPIPRAPKDDSPATIARQTSHRKVGLRLPGFYWCWILVEFLIGWNQEYSLLCLLDNVNVVA